MACAFHLRDKRREHVETREGGQVVRLAAGARDGGPGGDVPLPAQDVHRVPLQARAGHGAGRRPPHRLQSRVHQRDHHGRVAPRLSRP